MTMSKPSEKAMQAARDIQWEVVRGDDWTPGMLNHAASVIEKYTAEALSEHKRVLSECERALVGAVSYVNAFANKRWMNHEQAEKHTNDIAATLAAIAELKTNEKP